MKPNTSDQQKQAEADGDEAALKELKKCHPKTADYKPLNGFGYESKPEPSEKRLRRT